VKADQLYALARQQGGVFARWQALALGFSHYAIARRLESKEWVRVLGSVLAAASSVLGPASMEWAAYLACGPSAVLSGPSALRRHGIDIDARVGDRTWATIPPERHVRLPSVRTIRETVDPADTLMMEGMRITTLARSIVDTLRVVPDHVGLPILDRALLRRWLTIEELERRTTGLAGRLGVVRLRRLLTRVRGGARSAAERRLHAIIADIPGWVANYEVVNPSGIIIAVIDVAFPEHELAIEIDGRAFHSLPKQFQADRWRQNDLTYLNWRILRFTWDDLTERAARTRQLILRELAKQDPTHRSGFRVTSES
jgi:hypothetical protein